jgi:hypothetical protein
LLTFSPSQNRSGQAKMAGSVDKAGDVSDSGVDGIADTLAADKAK